MARNGVRLNRSGVAAVLKSPSMHAAVKAAAEAMADNVRSQGIAVGDVDGGRLEKPLPVKVDSQTTDRARATVTIAHPAGLAVQAKHGALTKAAAAAGLDVRAKK